MRKLRSKIRSVWFRYFLSSMIVLIVPMLIIATTYNQRYLEILNREISEEVYGTLAQTCDQLDRQLAGLDEVLMQLSTDLRFRKITLERGMLAYVDAVAALAALVPENGLVARILYAPHQSQYILSSASTYSYAIFPRIYAHPVEDLPSLLSDTAFRGSRIVPAAALRLHYPTYLHEESVLMHVQSIPVGSRFPQGNALLMLSAERLEQLLYGYAPGDACMILTDERGAILYARMRGPDLTDALLKTLFESEPGFLHWEDQHYVMVRHPLSNRPWQVTQLIPASTLMHTVEQTRADMVLMILVVFLIGCATTLGVSYALALPIRKLARSAPALPGNERPADEIALIQQHWSQALHRVAYLERHMLKNKHAIQHYLLFELLKGRFQSITEFNELGQELDLRLIHPFWVVLAVRFSHPVDMEEAQEYARAALSTNVECYFTDGMDDQIHLVVLGVYQDDMIYLHPILERMLRALREAFGNVSIGVGDVEDDPTRMNRMAAQAMTALEYRLIEGMNHVIFFADIVSRDASIDASIDLDEDLRAIRESILRGHADQLNQIVCRLVRRVREEGVPLPIAKAACHSLLIQLETLWEQLRDEEDGDAPWYLGMDAYQSMEEVTACVQSLGGWLAQKVLERERRKKAQFDHIMRYIHDHYTDGSLSLQRMADVFSMTVPSLSQMFKREMNENIWHYITAIRIERAKQLLTETNMSIQEIVLAVGYFDASSFTRRFKQFNGIPPGSYRANHQAN